MKKKTKIKIVAQTLIRGFKNKNWAKSPRGESSSQDNDESKDHTLKY